jgi:hypothetical protein
MKKTFVLMLVVLLMTAPMFAGVVKKSKSDVTFKGFGKFSLTQNEKLTADQKWTDSKSDFKGQGIAGGLAAKTILRPGEKSVIIDLPGSSVYTLDNKKKEYTVSPIKKISEETKGGQPKAQEETQGKEEAAESDVKITRNEFKVEDTGETATINNFPCRKYAVTWITDWENTKTGEKGSNRLTSLVWTTPFNGTLQAAQEEELRFSRGYLEKMEINTEKMQQDVLGTNWMTMMNSMGRNRAQTSPEESKVAAEMKKIEGYPVVIDGKYFVASTGGKPETGGPATEEQQEQPKSIGGVFGGLAKKVIKKKPAETEGGPEQPMLSFYTEVTELSLADLSKNDFQVPAGYKQKG